VSRGGVYFHSQFPFHDGEIGQKLFVVINEPFEDEPYIILKTTTNFRNKTYKEGCNAHQGVFYLPANKENAFPKDTLVQLLEIYDFSSRAFLKGHLTEKVISHIGNVSGLTMSQIINCIKQLKDDISEKHYKLIFKK